MDGILYPCVGFEPLFHRDHCHWAGVRCGDRREVIGLQWNIQHDLPGIHLAWTPSSIRAISIQNQKAKGGLCMRSLPRALIFLTLIGMGYSGSLDLRHLPKDIQTIDLRANSISGTVHLDSLPENLVSVNLKNNEIDAVYVDNEKLPKLLQKVLFGQRKWISFVCAGEEAVDSRIQNEIISGWLCV